MVVEYSLMVDVSVRDVMLIMTGSSWEKNVITPKF